jgi:putative spermidine/putrescine transport system permease protein
MTKRSHRLVVVLLVLPAVGYVSVFLGGVLVMTALQSVGFFSFRATSTIGLGEWAKVMDGQMWDSFLYSVRIALASALLGLALAYPLALYLRNTFRGKTIISNFLRVPLFLPALVAAFLILNIMSFNGILNVALQALGLIKEPLRMTHDEGGLGVLAIQIWKNLPFQTLILTAVLANVPRELEAAARNLGAGPFSVFRFVLFPLSLPGAVTGVVLVFIGVLGDFAVNSVAGPLYPPSLSIRMYLLAHTFSEWGQAACIAVIMMVTSLVFAVLLARLARLTARVVG